MEINNIQDLVKLKKISSEFAKQIENRISKGNENRSYELTDLQKQAFNKNIWYEEDKPHNMLISGATSSGKTLVAETIIANHIKHGKNAIYLVPLKAMVSEKTKHMLQDFESMKVFSSSSDHLEHDEDILHGKYDIAVIVYEKFFALLAQTSEMMDNCGVLVVDELQMLGMKERGAKLEFALLKVMENYRCVNIVGLTIAECDTAYVRQWLKVEDKEWVLSEKRPVGLDEYIIDLEGEYNCNRVYSETEKETGNEEDEKEGKITLVRNLPESVRSDEKKLCLLETILRKIYKDENSEKRVVVFVGSKSRSVYLARKICEYMLFQRDDEIVPAIEEELGFQDVDEYIDVLKKELLPFGIAIHNAGLSVQTRNVVEDNFENLDKKIKIIVATETLMIGMNMPVDAIILYDYKVFHDGVRVKLTSQQYKNYIGRAGRLGYIQSNSHVRGESYLLVEDKAARKRLCKEYLFPKKEKIVSSLQEANELEMAQYFMTLLVGKEDIQLQDMIRLMEGTLTHFMKKESDQYREKAEKVLEYAFRAQMVDKKTDLFFGTIYNLKDFGREMAPYALSLYTCINLKKNFFEGEMPRGGKKDEEHCGALPINATIGDILNERYLLDILYVVCMSREVKKSLYLKLPDHAEGGNTKETDIYNQAVKVIKLFLIDAKNQKLFIENSILNDFINDKEMESDQWNAVWRAMLLFYWTKGKKVQEIKKDLKIEGIRIITGDLGRLAEVCSYQIEAASKCIGLPMANFRGENKGDLQYGIYVFSRRVKYGLDRELISIANRQIFGLSRNAIIELGKAAREWCGEEENPNVIMYIKEAEETEWRRFLKPIQRKQLLLSMDERGQRGTLEDKIIGLFQKECLINLEDTYRLISSWNDIGSLEEWKNYLKNIFDYEIGVKGFSPKLSDQGIRMGFDDGEIDIQMHYIGEEELERSISYQLCSKSERFFKDGCKKIYITTGKFKGEYPENEILYMEWYGFMSLLVACIYEINDMRCGKLLFSVLDDLEGVIGYQSMKEWQKIVKNYSTKKNMDIGDISGSNPVLVYNLGLEEVQEPKDLVATKERLNLIGKKWSEFPFINDIFRPTSDQVVVWWVDEWMLHSRSLSKYIRECVEMCRENLLVVVNGNQNLENQIRN